MNTSSSVKIQKNFYRDIDGYRCIAALSIIAMHVYVKGEYTDIEPSISLAISKLGIFVTLFFIISGFGMCCGYFEKIKNSEISVETFYSRRIKKILPFFSLLVIIDIIVERFASSSLWEGIANLSLVFNLLPDLNIQVIGVGWALGVIFLFYLLFPYFVFLLSSKPRAWIAFALSIILSLSCIFYFHKADGQIDDRRFIYQAMFFVAGGLLFLYRNQIEGISGRNSILLKILCIGVLPLIVISVPSWLSNIKQLVIWIPWMMLAIHREHRLFTNKFTSFISRISLEMYLSHLFIFQIVNLIGIPHLFGFGITSYIFTYVLVLVGTAVFSLVAQKIIQCVCAAASRK
ncbi:acyltransferase family protein [Collinsella tanakaei]|uniref:acyltransferase family protein n=1 Tax=Collinsella tanakaei TaxID=626935 RepID=UPI0019574924|nr:acyltransferase [Collinsella tanakaei]MBM6868105.1 acyltransferase [Collinsella tanakaei]